MNILVVYAHHDANSFVHALLERAQRTLTAQGHEAVVSDLHAMHFKAVADDADFTTASPPGGAATDYQSRQRIASRDDGYAPDIVAEHDKLVRADAVIFLFPYYWFHAPAILKGWFDRVLAYDRIYSNDHPVIGAYGRGGLAGKRALIGVTLGAPEPSDGAVPSRHSERFEAIQNGVLAYAGFDVMAPFYAWSVAHVGDARRSTYLDRWEARVHGLFTDAPELAAGDGPTPQPPALRDRVRNHGDRVLPYGNDRAIAGAAAVERLRARPGQAQALIDRLSPLVAAASPDRANRIYAVLRARDDPDEVWLIQTYDDSAAWDRHAAAAPFDRILVDIAELLAEKALVVPLLPITAKGL